MQYLKLLPLIVAAFNIVIAFAISPIKAVGSKFFTDDGKQFFMKGVAYQLIEDDPLVDNEQCKRDATLMKYLGANAIRVYHVDATADHSACMATFADAGIYLFVDLDSFHTYISYGDIGPSWTQNKSDSYRAVMDNFQQYDNTGGFFVGNEVLNGLVDSGAAPFVLAAAVDMAAYRDAKGYRKIPIGYSATDTGALPMLQDYFVCRPSERERLEFYSLNSYRWCGTAATYNTSGYNQLQQAGEGYPIPMFFSEVGCNQARPREFHDQAAIFGPSMMGTWSGSIVYEWIEEVNDYGLISYGPKLADNVQIGTSVIQGYTRQGTPTPILPDFANLRQQWAALSPTGIMSSAYVTAISTRSRQCPTKDGSWTVDPSAPLPTLGAAVTGSTSTPRSSSRSSASGAGTSSTSSGVATKNTFSPVLSSSFTGRWAEASVIMALSVGVLMLVL